jgi:hypothetical protein
LCKDEKYAWAFRKISKGILGATFVIGRPDKLSRLKRRAANVDFIHETEISDI